MKRSCVGAFDLPNVNSRAAIIGSRIRCNRINEESYSDLSVRKDLSRRFIESFCKLLMVVWANRIGSGLYDHNRVALLSVLVIDLRPLISPFRMSTIFYICCYQIFNLADQTRSVLSFESLIKRIRKVCAEVPVVIKTTFNKRHDENRLPGSPVKEFVFRSRRQLCVGCTVPANSTTLLFLLTETSWYRLLAGPIGIDLAATVMRDRGTFFGAREP